MKKISTLLAFALTINYSLLTNPCNAQTCATGGCTSAAETNQYPAATFSTSTNAWATVSAYMNAGNWTLFNVTSGDVYEWTYCSDFGGTQAWDPELTLFNNAGGATLCYANNCGRTNCSTAPYIRWAATFTGTVRLLTTVSGCLTNTGSPFSTLRWRDTSGTVPVAGTSNTGIDVSHYQSPINWTQVKAGGVTFAWAKATQGTTYTDVAYITNATGGVAAGVYMGAYHFADANINPTTAGAVAEANKFSHLSTI